MHLISRCHLLSAAVLTLGACDTATLPTGAMLNVSFEASILDPADPPTTPPTDKASCVAAHGAIVDLRAWTPDGRPAEAAQVTLWLEPALDGQLIALNDGCADGRDDICVNLDDSGQGNACLFPGGQFGTITVFAHSGVVQQSKSIDVVDHVLRPGSTLEVGVVPVDLSRISPRAPSMCGPTAAPSCVPASPRSAFVTLLATSPAGAPPPRDGTVASLTVTAGWISADVSCASVTEPLPIAEVKLMNGVGSATWCFGDEAATGTVRAQSGSISATGAGAVAAIPTGVVLTSTATTVASGDDVTLTATVTSCDGHGVGNTPVLFRTTSGTATISPAVPVITNEQGIATVIATPTSAATIEAALAQAQGVKCSIPLEVTP